MKEKKARKPARWSPQTLVKREFIARTIKNFGNHLLPRETKILNQLFESLTTDLDFWRSLELPYQLNSLAFLKQERGWELLQAEYKKYKFIPEIKEKVELSETNYFLVDGGAKIEENKEMKKSNLREQLRLW